MTRQAISDRLWAFIGALVSQLLLALLHDRQLARLGQPRPALS